jgi:hypothetical protein
MKKTTITFSKNSLFKKWSKIQILSNKEIDFLINKHKEEEYNLITNVKLKIIDNKIILYKIKKVKKLI